MLTEGEVTCIHHMIHGQQSGALEEAPWDSSVLFSSVRDEREKLVNSLEKLSEVIDKLSEYVDNVVSGKEAPNVEIGMAISNAIDAVDVIRPEDFHGNFQVI